MSPLLEVRGLKAGYGHVRVLHGVDLAVDEGAAVAVLGPNGAGKSTLLRTLMGTLPASAGTIVLDGTDVTRSNPARRARLGLAHVPEGRRLFGAMSVEENLRVAGQINPRRRETMAQVFDLLPRLYDLRRRRADTLSGGEQQMLAIGRALMTGPRCLLVDELSAGLAPAVTLRLLEALQRIRAGGMALLLVEQSPHFLDGLAEQVYLLRQGAVVASGRIEALGGLEGIARLYLGAERARGEGREGP